MISFDTNVLVYAADGAAGERHRSAADLIERSVRRGNCIQTLQSLCEFFSVVTRKSGIEASTIADLDEAIRAVEAYRIGFWDALLWATVRRAGVRLLVSEDFQDGQALEGVRIVNPFAARNSVLIEQALGD